MTNDEKYQVITQLQSRYSPRDIAEDLGLSYSQVLRFKRQYEEAKLNNSIDNLLNVQEAVIGEVMEQTANEAVTLDDIAELTDGVKGLAKLQTSLQSAASDIVARTQSLVLSADSVTELALATEVICDLQNAFFNKNSTQVNIQNNVGGDSGTPKYTQFLGDTPNG